MSLLTAVRLALAGSRVDTLRVVLTAVTAALATVAALAAATVLAIPTPPADVAGQVMLDQPGQAYGPRNSEQYSNALLREPGLRGGVAFALLMLTIPVLALAAQCVRLGAPARDRRLANIRLAGATPRQAVFIAATETGLACLLGSLVGLVVYLIGRSLAHRLDANGKLPLPTDVLPDPLAIAAIVLGIPLVAVGVAALLMLRVAITPYGVVRRTEAGRPGAWPGLLIVSGLGLGAGAATVARWLEERGTEISYVIFAIGLVLMFVLAGLGVVLGTGWLSYTAGRVLQRFGRGPATLLASRRLMADPWTGSRTFAALLTCVIFGCGAIGMRVNFAASFAVEEESGRRAAEAMGESYYPGRDTGFYFRALDLVDLAVLVGLVIAGGGLMIALAEAIVSRRRAYAAMVATGVPRRTLAAALLWQTAAPVVPAVLIAMAAGFALIRGVFGSTVQSGTTTVNGVASEPIIMAIPIPYADLAAFAGQAIAAVLVVTAVGLLFLRASTDIEELRTG